jgi:DNA mismatch endonuclease, patch repair protein
MSAIRSRDNKTETALRSALHELGLRYRKHASYVVGKPDIIFPTERIAVFIDGDYWHGRRLREEGVGALHSYYTAKQTPYWVAKMQRNVARDDYVTATLQAEGWHVLRYWESEVRANITLYARRIASIVRRRRRHMATLGRSAASNRKAL